MRGVVLGLGLATLLAQQAWGQTIVNPDWARRPSGDDIARYYPDEAVDTSIGGKVTLQCLVAASGVLRDCEVLSETPAGVGFGKAAVRMAEALFRMTPLTVDGKPVDGAVIKIPLNFAPNSRSARGIITEAVWEAAPSFEDVAAAWPESAGDIPVGTSLLRCTVGSQADLRNCTIVGQTPKGSPFGGAARSLVGKFKLKIAPEDLEKFAFADIAVSFRFYNPATPAGRAKKVEKPDWIARIDPARIVALYPVKAADAGVMEGVGVADCLVAPDGKLTDCRVSREAPADMGFGASAIVAASVLQMDPWTPEGRPVAGARVKVPIKFSLAPEAEAEDAAPAAP